MKGILMTAPNHLATRKKIKIMTRRLDGLKEINKEPDNWTYHEEQSFPKLGRFVFQYDNRKPYHREIATVVAKPRYQVGEVVYIKEAHYRYGHWEKTGRLTKAGRQEWAFIAETNEIRYRENKPEHVMRSVLRISGWYKRSPLFLPADLARDFIKITKVGIGRLQDITEEEAKAEGAECVIWHGEHAMAYENQILIATYKAGFANLWDSINGKRNPYDSNPWNWEISYELLESKP